MATKQPLVSSELSDGLAWHINRLIGRGSASMRRSPDGVRWPEHGAFGSSRWHCALTREATMSSVSSACVNHTSCALDG